VSDRRESAPRASLDYVEAAELDQVPVRVACSPLPTVFRLTRDALQDGRESAPQAWRSAVLSNLRRVDAATLAPLTDPRCKGWPDMLTDNHAPFETLGEALERLAALPAEGLLEVLEGDPDSVVPGTWWDPVRRAPDRWLRSYVDAFDRAGRSLEPLWRRSTALLEREVERIEAAAERGVPTTQLVREVHTRASLLGGRLQLVPTAAKPRHLRVDERGVILVPMIVGCRKGIIGTPGGQFTRTAYPLAEAWRVFDDQAPPPATLEALVGPQRSRLLRRLDQPQVAGELGAVLNLSPSATTFHLRALEAAGLIARDRRGRNVVVRRTQRGSGLLALYEFG
jgi:DNA-binding transcriptional ArsR family regulator